MSYTVALLRSLWFLDPCGVRFKTFWSGIKCHSSDLGFAYPSYLVCNPVMSIKPFEHKHAYYTVFSPSGSRTRMDIRKCSRKRPCSSESTEAPTDEQDTAQPCSSGDLPPTNPTNPPGISKAKQRKVYKARLSYKKQWEQTYPWVYCKDPSEGMFCKLCQKRGNPPPTARVPGPPGE